MDREQRRRRTILVTAYACALLSFAITAAIAERLDRAAWVILLACTIVGTAVAWSSVFDALGANS